MPDGFRFAVKAPDGLERRLATFEERVRCLGDRLGCVRVVVERPRDDGFRELLFGSADPGIRYALDLRDPSWDGVEERLAEAGAVRVDDDRRARPGWAYLRYRELLLHGRASWTAIAAELADARASAASRRSRTSAMATTRTPPRQRCGSQGWVPHRLLAEARPPPAKVAGFSRSPPWSVATHPGQGGRL